MAFAFDTLCYSKKLHDAGIPQDQAEAHAEAAREFIMVELVTKTDLLATTQALQATIENLGLRLTVRMGVMLAAGLTLLGAVLKLHQNSARSLSSRYPFVDRRN